jgi:hypothetical protein
MSLEVAERLRALARDHAEGRLSLPLYRQLRAPLLDRLVGIERSVESNWDITRRRTAPAPATTGPSRAQWRASWGRLAWVAVALAVLLMLGALWWRHRLAAAVPLAPPAAPPQPAHDNPGARTAAAPSPGLSGGGSPAWTAASIAALRSG